MQNKKLIILAQFFISLMMAFTMTGLFSFIELGFTPLWITTWFERFIIAWPIAFILSIIVGKIGFTLAEKTLGVFDKRKPITE